MATVNDWERPDAATEGFVVPPGEGEPVPTKPNARAKATGANTGGLVLVHEAVITREDRIVRHRHTNLAEVFYVLEGEVRLQIGDKVTTASAGTLAFSPVGNVHAFRNLGDRPARLLIMALPPEPGERFFVELERMTADADEAAWEQLNRRVGVEVVGPPLEG